jgi:ribose transport system substrate-binding protein
MDRAVGLDVDIRALDDLRPVRAHVEHGARRGWHPREAIQEAGKLEPVDAKGHILVIGIDGIPQALQAIRHDTLDATFSQNPVKWAVKAVDFAQDISNGKQPERHIDYPYILLDKSNIESPEAKSYGLWGDLVAH